MKKSKLFILSALCAVTFCMTAPAEEVRAFLVGVLRDTDASDKEAAVAEFPDEPENVRVVGDAEVAADLIFFDILCGYDDDDLRLVCQLHEHLELGIGLKAG